MKKRPEFSYKLRPASESDRGAIRSLIREAGINPLGLDWRRFLLAVEGGDRIIGCGQIRVHRDGSSELASIAVREDRRGCGVATGIILRLLEGAAPPLWLICRGELTSFYQPFGFKKVEDVIEIPEGWRRVRVLVRALRIFRKIGGQGSIMIMKDRGGRGRKKER
jgi:N-acetylglutamate synthase-like GNAT family acetyltransferase